MRLHPCHSPQWTVTPASHWELSRMYAGETEAAKHTHQDLTSFFNRSHSVEQRDEKVSHSAGFHQEGLCLLWCTCCHQS